MTKVILRFGLLFIFSFLMVSLTEAQVSVKMGYGVGFVKPEPHGIFSYLRAHKTYMEDKQYKNMQGVLLGVRYHNEYFATEFDFDYNFWTIQGSGDHPTAGKRENLKASLVNTSLGLGVEGLFGNIGVGTSVHYNIFSQKRKSNVEGNIKDRTNYLSQKLFIGIYISGSKHTTLAFRPFVEIPYGKVNFQYTERMLNGDSRPELKKADFDYRPSAFGLQFLFLNGG